MCRFTQPENHELPTAKNSCVRDRRREINPQRFTSPEIDQAWGVPSSHNETPCKSLA
jgi:hypothetical protein